MSLPRWVFTAAILRSGEAFTRPMRELGTPVFDLSAIAPYLTVQSAWDPFYPHVSLNYYWKGTHLNALTDKAVDAFAGLAMRKPAADSLLLLWHFGGAVS